ncbi:hypothetical protein IscW_ISCW005031 [Ixodes scapularis]|uniref:Uncharacterized protein n=1 Tax=Ixodes scapularis TaxID=6945 RepID=B7PH56_IXOSC|nr:hypothetical protein IscW_ISCW005031 [Ixodes scapularis]|eukprot:XP_002402223.1 hypothetical protein IscW_ISCW005031 [Ixodes scapularis]
MAATRETETTEDTDGKMDSRLAHLIEAKQSITNRWRQQRLNRSLRKKIAELNKKIQEHCTKLSSQQWDDMCHKADKQMHNGATWRLLRHLIDETKTKVESAADRSPPSSLGSQSNLTGPGHPNRG